MLRLVRDGGVLEHWDVVRRMIESLPKEVYAKTVHQSLLRHLAWSEVARRRLSWRILAGAGLLREVGSGVHHGAHGGG